VTYRPEILDRKREKAYREGCLPVIVDLSPGSLAFKDFPVF
jgi:hypothetical protein